MQNSEIKKGAGYFDELALRFRREHIDCAASEDDRLPVLLDGREVGIVTPGGGIRVRKESIDDPIANELYHRAGAIAAEVHEYMELMKNAPPLKAVSLSDPYKLLAEFNGYVFGGMESKYGVQFTTWEWTYNKTGLTHGHYCCNDYAAAKQDFALRAGLVDKTLIFPDEMLVEMYRCAGQMFVPFWYIKLTAGHFKKDVAVELETALSIITTAYLRNEDLQTSVEENISYLNPPVKGVFQNFLTRIQHIDPDVNAALTELRTTIDNEVWREWCDALAACQYDRSLKTTLTPIVSKLSDTRIINGELENLVFGPRKEFISMAALVVLNIPLLYFLNKDWYGTLMHTIPGQAVLALCAAAIFISFAFVVKLTQPIEYRR